MRGLEAPGVCSLDVSSPLGLAVLAPPTTQHCSGVFRAGLRCVKEHVSGVGEDVELGEFREASVGSCWVASGCFMFVIFLLQVQSCNGHLDAVSEFAARLRRW